MGHGNSVADSTPTGLLGGRYPLRNDIPVDVLKTSRGYLPRRSLGGPIAAPGPARSARRRLAAATTPTSLIPLTWGGGLLSQGRFDVHLTARTGTRVLGRLGLANLGFPSSI